MPNQSSKRRTATEPSAYRGVAGKASGWMSWKACTLARAVRKTARPYAAGERRDLAVLQPDAPRESSVPEPQLSGIVRGEDLTLVAADQASCCYEGHAAEWHRGAQCLV
jgi:hypothetical protein